MAYWSGLVEGFQARRESELLKNYQLEEKNRQMADRVYTHLLQSRDPRMQEMALSALANPIQRKKGLGGFLGQVEADPFMGQIVDRMNEMVPDEGMGGGPAPPRPGSAAMSTNVPVEPGSQPLQLPGQPLPPEPPPAMPGGGPAGPPPLGPQAAAAAPGVGMPPPPAPVESKWKRRGTGVPTAEEIAEASAHAQRQGQSRALVEQLTAAGASPQEIEDALLASYGLPRSERVSPVAQWGVQLTTDGPVQPVFLDQSTRSYVLPGGRPLPPGAQMVRMTSGGGVPRSSKIPDPNSSTGWSKVFYDTASGEELYRVDDTPFVPPPVFAGTGTFAEPGTGVPIRGGIPRGGGAPISLGDVPSEEPSKLQTDAKALVTIIDRRINLERRPRVPLRPGRLDEVAREEARKMGLTFQSYAEVVRASTSTPPVTPRERTEGGSAVERVLRNLQQRGVTGGGVPPPPPAPPARATGAGPRR